MGVFLACSTSTEAILIDRRLYLPAEWANDPRRCEKAGIPMEARGLRTKAELCLEMILKAKKRGIPFEFVGMDAHDGEQPWLNDPTGGERCCIRGRCFPQYQSLPGIPGSRFASQSGGYGFGFLLLGYGE